MQWLRMTFSVHVPGMVALSVPPCLHSLRFAEEAMARLETSLRGHAQGRRAGMLAKSRRADAKSVKGIVQSRV